MALTKTLQQDIIQLFWKTGWAHYPQWIYYTAITKALNAWYLEKKYPLKKGSTIERAVRLLAQRGILESNRRGNFKWRHN